MTDKIKGSNGGADSGGGRGGGGEIMESTFNGGGGNESKFHKLLPNIAEAVEMLDTATVEEVQIKLEEMTSVKYTKSELIHGLEDGLQLGLFDMERQFKVNSKWINEKLKANAGDIGKIASFVKKKLQEERKRGLSSHCKEAEGLWAKSFQTGRNKRSNFKEALSPINLNKSKRLMKVCDRCKKKINSTSEESESESDIRDSDSDISITSEPSITKNVSKRSGLKSEVANSKRKKFSSPERQDNHQMPQKKSKLLVEKKNPLENDSPYDEILA